ncbi:HyaD/HybD family hydrogenase maturation endopeptidase [Verrucomicrobiaceae bacterium E54]|nr:HyaD/HybD family hydrogenase maturation endopeptidase [Verrucomicrobiaceae bacterium E54]
MKTLILGIGNLLLSDEGFGVHFVRHLEGHYLFPEDVEIFDGGTLGLMATHKYEAAERVYLVDTLAIDGEPGECRRYGKDQLLHGKLPVKLSPHQAGVQEMMMVSELRGCGPPEVTLLGVIPASFESSIELTPPLQERLHLLAGELVEELRSSGHAVEEIE